MLQKADSPDLDGQDANVGFITCQENNTYSNQIASLVSNLDGTVQKFVYAALHARIWLLSHCPVLAGHLRERRLYDTLCKNFYWPHMANFVIRPYWSAKGVLAQRTSARSPKETKIVSSLRFAGIYYNGHTPSTV